MVLVSDDSSVIGSLVGSNLCYFICLSHLIRSRVVTNRILFSEIPVILHAGAKCSELQSIIGSMGKTGYRYVAYPAPTV